MVPPTSLLFETTHTFHERRVVSSSEAASLGGKPAKTPIIAGAVCGGVVLIAWAIGFGIYFRKRYNRKKRKRLAERGEGEPPQEKLIPQQPPSQTIVIPPDPAVLLGYAKPGEMVHPHNGKHGSEASSSKGHFKSHSKSRPSSPRGGKGLDEMAEPLNPHP